MKKYFLSSLAIAVAVGFSAFTTIKANARANSDYYFVYTGTSQSPSALSNPANYEYKGSTPSCGGGADECAVEVSLSSAPTLDSTLPSGDVTFNAITGVPDGGTDFVANETEN